MPRDPLARRAKDARAAVLGVLDHARKHGGTVSGPEHVAALEHAAALLYNLPEGPHFVVIEEEGYRVEHPDECSKDGADVKVDCIVGAAMEEWLRFEVAPPVERGRYRADYDEDTGSVKLHETG